MQIAPDLDSGDGHARPRSRAPSRRPARQGREAGRVSRDVRALVSLFLLRPSAGRSPAPSTCTSTTTRSSCPARSTEAVAAAARRHNIVVVLGVNERDHGTLYNAQLIFDADGALVLKRRKITPTFHERMIWGQGDGVRPEGRRHRGRAGRRAGLLGALQSARPLRADGAARRDSRRAVSGLAGRADLRRPDRGDDPPSRAGERLLRRQRHRLADRRADREDFARREAAQGADAAAA